jgi:hypothetical protein
MGKKCSFWRYVRTDICFWIYEITDMHSGTLADINFWDVSRHKNLRTSSLMFIAHRCNRSLLLFAIRLVADSSFETINALPKIVKRTVAPTNILRFLLWLPWLHQQMRKWISNYFLAWRMSATRRHFICTKDHSWSVRLLKLLKGAVLYEFLNVVKEFFQIFRLHFNI